MIENKSGWLLFDYSALNDFIIFVPLQKNYSYLIYYA